MQSIRRHRNPPRGGGVETKKVDLLRKEKAPPTPKTIGALSDASCQPLVASSKECNAFLHMLDPSRHLAVLFKEWEASQWRVVPPRVRGASFSLSLRGFRPSATLSVPLSVRLWVCVVLCPPIKSAFYRLFFYEPSARGERRTEPSNVKGMSSFSFAAGGGIGMLESVTLCVKQLIRDS